MNRTFLLVLALCAALAACDDDSSAAPNAVVMTQNVYYGFDVGPLLAAGSPEEIPVLAAQAFQQLLGTDFPERAAAMADKIARERPHLIGLQEVALIRYQSPGDAVAGGQAPAETALYDYLAILLDALAVRGLDYRVAGKIQNVDVELPMLVGLDPLAFDDIRLTDFDVVLARGDVALSNVVEANFAARAFVPSLGLEIPRGYVAVDADLGGGRTCRFVSTHLEDVPFDDIQRAQAEELAAALAPETKTVMLVGDFNSPAPAGATYRFLAAQGYSDAWTMGRAAHRSAGLTWGHDPDLRNANDAMTQRLDLVLARSAFTSLGTSSVEVWGDDLDERTATGMWPSDHAGVIARWVVRP
jgi:endonuclease/exonuclease/phosphatase family metal-dependent hydrolase